MTTFAMRKRLAATGKGATTGRAGAIAFGLVALIAILAALRVAPDLRVWWDAVPGSDAASLAHVFLFDLNLPRVAAALVAGGCLGIAGALFQSLTRNPLASPDLLGVTGGAQLGLLAAMLVPALAGVATVPLLFVCGLVAAACAIVAAGGWRATPLRLVLAGSVCMLLFAALSTLVLAFFEQNIAGAALWTNGSLYQPGATGLALAARWLVVPLIALPFVIRPLNPLTLGDDAAAAAGVRVDATRLAATIVAVAFTSVAVSIAGPLSYVGLVAPNLLRQVRGARAARLGVLVPLSALTGGALVLVTDSAVLASGLDATLSTGVAIALVGTPLMLAMIRRGAAWSGVLHADAERAAGGGSTRLVGWLERLGWPLRTALFVVVGALVVWVGVSAGPEWLSPARWSAALSGHDALARMLIDLRMPRLLCALLAGALLAVSGVAMQSVVRNPLAGPEVLGVTQGAGLVTLFALSTWPLMGHVTLAAAALIGGGLSLAITLALNHRHRYAPLAVALTGIVIGALWTTLAQWLITQESVQPARFVVWLVGGTYGRSWGEVSMLLPWCVLAVPVFAWLAKPLDMLALGDDQAAALGLPVAALRPLALTIATLAACAAVAAVGPVGFIGLMAPHVATMLGARRHRTRLWLAAACGALILGVADLAARTVVAPREVPAGVLTALIGAPYLLGLLILEGAPRPARRAMTPVLDDTRATRFSAFAPEPFAEHLDVVWLGMPDDVHASGRIVVPVTELPAHRDAVLDAMVGHYGGDPAQHARALMSQWSKYYFGRAAPAGVVAALTLGRPLDMNPARTFVALDDGMPAALYFEADALGTPCDDPAPRYAGLIAHLGAVIDLLAAMGRVTPRVLWSNAGNLLDYLLGTYRTLPCAADPVRDADWLFGSTCIRGESNPLRQPVRDAVPRSALLPTPFRARRVCCLRYEIPGETQLCGSCPLLLTMDDAALAEQDAIR